MFPIQMKAARNQGNMPVIKKVASTGIKPVTISESKLSN